MAIEGIIPLALPANAPGLQDRASVTSTLTLPVSLSNAAVTFSRRPDQQSTIAAARLAGQVSGLDAGRGNAKEAAALLDVADTALKTISTKIDRLKEIAQQASTTTPSATQPVILSDQQRSILDEEFARLRAEIDEIANTTEFEGQKILAGGSGTDVLLLNINAGGGADAQDTVALSLQGVTSTQLSASFATADVATVTSATAAVTSVQAAADTLSQARANVSAGGVRIDSSAASSAKRSFDFESERNALLATKVTVDFTRVETEHVIDQRNIVPELRDSLQLQQTLDNFKAAGVLPTSIESSSPESEATSDADTKDEPAKKSSSTSESNGGSDNSGGRKKSSVDILA